MLRCTKSYREVALSEGGGWLREVIIELVKQAPSVAILLYLLIRQDNFIQYLVEQCVVRTAGL